MNEENIQNEPVLDEEPPVQENNENTSKRSFSFLKFFQQKKENAEEFTEEKKDNNTLEVMNRISAEIIDWLEVVSSAVIIVVLIFSFLFRIATIDGDSMLNTLHNGEKVVITNLFYKPQRGDIVVISRNTNNSLQEEDPNQLPIIKRVIATEGQTVDIDFINGVVYVDGEELEEPYTKAPTLARGDLEYPVTVPTDCVFVLGDNRNESLDSRFSRIGEDGMIHEKYILGHAILRVFPFQSIGGLDS